MIDFTVTGGERVVQKLQNVRTSLIMAIYREVQRLDALVMQRAQELVSGEMLNNRSGRLLGSIREVAITATDTTIEGGVEAGGGPAFYAKFQHAGTRGPYKITPVTKLALAFFPQGSSGANAIATGGPALQSVRSLYKSYRVNPELKRNPKALSSFSSQGGVVVKSVMHPGLKARPFMSVALEEKREEIIAGIRAAVQKGLAEA